MNYSLVELISNLLRMHVYWISLILRFHYILIVSKMPDFIDLFRVLKDEISDFVGKFQEGKLFS